MAEGLIPFVYRAIKRRKAPRRYHSLSSASAAAGAAAAAVVAASRIPEDHAVADNGAYYISPQYNHHHRRQPERRHSMDARPWTPATLQLGGSARKDGDGQQNHHRRWATVDDFAYGDEYGRQQQYYGEGQQQPPLAKSRSSRVFSCITGM